MICKYNLVQDFKRHHQEPVPFHLPAHGPSVPVKLSAKLLSYSNSFQVQGYILTASNPVNKVLLFPNDLNKSPGVTYWLKLFHMPILEQSLWAGRCRTPVILSHRPCLDHQKEKQESIISKSSEQFTVAFCILGTSISGKCFSVITRHHSLHFYLTVKF